MTIDYIKQNYPDVPVILDAKCSYSRACAMINSASIMMTEKKYDAALKYYANAEKLNGIVEWQKKTISNGIKNVHDALKK
ncbi:MAG: hypothetical protein WC071_06765 [Victivallaceae bacterium]